MALSIALYAQDLKNTLHFGIEDVFMQQTPTDRALDTNALALSLFRGC
ncbi:MAG: hypothetical protein RIT24_2599 [Planctomycetota bacterium]|jgi:hypothetical protein